MGILALPTPRLPLGGSRWGCEQGAASAASLANGYAPPAAPKWLFHADFPGNPRVASRPIRVDTGRPPKFLVVPSEREPTPVERVPAGAAPPFAASQVPASKLGAPAA